MQYSIENVQNVLKSFYFPQQYHPQQEMNVVMRDAQEWLMSFQRSPQAWTLSQQLLYQGGQVEFQYFGASTIESKLKSEWSSMSTELQSSILGQILQILQNPLNLHRTVLTRLVLSVSVIACHAVPTLWPNPIYDILKLGLTQTNQDSSSSSSPSTPTDELYIIEHYLNPSNPNINLILELLTILPFEVTQCDFITQDARTQVSNRFNRSIDSIIKLLSNLLSIQNQNNNNQNNNFNLSTIKNNSLKCLKSWIIFNISPSSFLTSPLVMQYGFDSVQRDAQLVEEFVSVLSEIVTFMGGKHFKQYPTTFNTMLGRVLETLPRYAQLAVLEENEQIFHHIFSLFTQIAETHPKLLMASKLYCDAFLDAFSDLVAKGDMESCEPLSLVITEIHSLHDNDVDVSSFYKFLKNLIPIYRDKCMYPLDSDSNLLAEASAEFDRFIGLRNIVGDSLLSIYGILEESTKSILLSMLWNDISQYNNNIMAVNGWRAIESTIFLLGFLSEGISSNDDTSFVPQLFQLLGALPAHSTPLVKSTIILAGKYANLLEKSSQYLYKIVSDFIPAFSNPELATSASDSFLSISKNKKCASLLSNNLKDLIIHCSPILNITNLTVYFNIIEGLFEISSVLNPGEILNNLSPLLTPHITILNQLSIKQHLNPTETTQITNSLKLLIRFMKIFEIDDGLESQPSQSPPLNPANNNNNNNTTTITSDYSLIILPIVEIILPITRNLITNNDNDEILENVCLLCKRIILSCNKNAIVPMLPTIFFQMTNLFLKHPSCAAISTMSFGVGCLSLGNAHDYVSTALTTLTNIMIDLWKRHVNESIQRHQQQYHHHPNNQYQQQPTAISYNLSIQPDLTKDFFAFITQSLKYNVLSIPQGLSTLLFQILLDNLLFINDKPTARPCFQFLSFLISMTKEESNYYINIKNELDQFLNQNGELLIKQLLTAVGGGIPRSVSPYVSETIFALVSKYPNIFRPIALKFLSIDGFPSNKVTFDQKQLFLNKLMRLKGKSPFKEAVSDFYLNCLVNIEQIKGLLELIKKDDIVGSGEIIKTLADWSRVEENRNIIAKESNILDVVVSLIQPYKDSDDNNRGHLNEMICRLLGNLCFEHEDNRELIQNHKDVDTIIKTLVEFVKQTTRPSLRKTACAAIANISSCSEFFQGAFYETGIVDIIFSLLADSNTSQDVKQWATQALKNVVEDNLDNQTNIKHSDLVILLNQLKQSIKQDGWIDNTFALELINLLSSFLINEKLKKETLNEGMIDEILNLIDQAEPTRELVDELDEEEINEITGEVSVAPLAAEAIVKLAEKDQLREYFLKGDVIERMIKIIGSKPPVFSQQSKKTTLRVLDLAKTKRFITRALAYVSLEDASVEKLMDHVQLFIDMFDEQDTEQMVSSAMLIGNLSINEKNIKILLEKKVLEKMTENLKTYPNHQPIQHLILAAIRNITNPSSAFKGTVISKDLMDCIVTNMRVQNQVIQYTAIGVLKHVTLCSDQNYILFMQDSYNLQALLDLANGVTKASIEEEDEEEEEKKPKDKRVAYESTRILKRFLEMKNVLSEESTKENLTRDCVGPFFELLNAPFAILRCEGSRGVNQLYKTDSTLIDITNEHHWKSIVSALKESISSLSSQDTAFNQETVSTLLEILNQQTKDESICQKIKSLDAITSLKNLIKLDSITPTVKSTIQQLLVQISI
ncbi:importin 13 [Cavenderia fasciculata]|uniref:Importin 13 n=1 Tax=Cavenderia fasciculata TaxID=261658 RepID=F4Q5E5_CACFS|nr:importin 13 [Cavenderia fasciculata]EGG17204.1 importin 13 [Cavenderia fasciculata]|eukprot:XP_004355688.1 importin 13 [Cavenderia fasciculata]